MTVRAGFGLRMTVLAIILPGLVLPILVGAAFAVRASFGVLPAIGATDAGLAPWIELLAAPGMARSVQLTVAVGVVSTGLSLAVALSVMPVLHRHLSARAWARLLVPFLAAPHAALAIGLAFVLAPSGWIARLVSPWATGWDVPPDLPTVNDPYGLALIVGLMVKEVPFLLLVILSALGRIPLTATLHTGQSLGYPPQLVWRRLILPQVYPLIRLPIYVVLSFSLSVVDVALVLGPGTPPPLAVAMTRWFQSADTAMMLPASAAAVLQTLIVAAAIGFWRIAEGLVSRTHRQALWRHRPASGVSASALTAVWMGAGAVVAVLGLLAILSSTVWSFTWRWPFSHDLPDSLSLQSWLGGLAGWGRTALTTTGIAMIATMASLVLSILWLEAEDRGHMVRARWAEGLIYLPLILPQVAFLPGVYAAMLGTGFRPGFLSTVWAHILFVFPYVMLSLSDPWRALDRHQIAAAASLGAGPWRRLWAIKLPLLVIPLATAAAISFAVSVALYLPTMFAGGGRVATLTTEAVASSSGSDRRIQGVYATLQMILPFVVYVLAIAVPRVAFRNRRGMLGGA